MVFDYQSVRHCSKTTVFKLTQLTGLITSQFDTAPKPYDYGTSPISCLITSQFDTAPKLSLASNRRSTSLITSQFDTAPKLTSPTFGTSGV